MFLARKLGRTVDELRATITPAEFWMQLTYDQRRAAEVRRAREEARQGR